MTVSGAKSDFDVRSLAELMESLRPALPFLEKLVALGRQRYGESAAPSADQKTREIIFTNTEVIVDGRHMSKDVSLLLTEAVILKRNVSWLWAYIILPQFDAKNPDNQFRNYVAKRRKEFAGYGIHLATLKKRGMDGMALCNKIDGHVVSNIGTILSKYEEALSLYNKDVRKAVETLLCIAEDSENTWYTFTNAYLDLVRWICELDFEGISESIIRKCENFLAWYIKRLKYGISKIELYKKNKGLTGEALEIFEGIKAELDKAQKLYSALVEHVAIDPEEKPYEDFVSVLFQTRECLLSTREKSQGMEILENKSIDVIKKLAKVNKHLAEIIDNGCTAWDRILEAKRQRSNCSKEEVEDMREDIHWHMADIILATTNFDEFDTRGGNKLTFLKQYLYSCLQQKIKHRIEGTHA